jgi:hypothetical protein
VPFGIGYGNAFGDGAIIPLSEPLSEVGGPPQTFDFTTDPDSPLPGLWQFFVLSDDGAGNKTTTAEIVGGEYFRVTDGLGWWRYTRVPAIPGGGDPFDEHGLVASPMGIALGRNLEIAIAFLHPPDLLDGQADEFEFEATLGFRSSTDATKFYGAHVRASWTNSGGWSPGIAFELVQASGQAPVVLLAATFPAVNTPTDSWYGGATSELRVIFRGTTMTGIFNGVTQLVATIPDIDSGPPIVMVECWNRYGALINSLPCVTGVTLQTLRDLVRLGETTPIVGDSDLSEPILPVVALPIADLSNKGIVKRTGARTWQFTQDTTVYVPNHGTGNTYLAGTTVRMQGEPLAVYRDQEFVSIVPDLAALRAAKERE